MIHGLCIIKTKFIIFGLFFHIFMYNKLDFLTGGGDAPGLNAVIRAVVRTATGNWNEVSWNRR